MRETSASVGHIQLLTEYDPEGTHEVDDPYYGGDSGFEKIVRRNSGNPSLLAVWALTLQSVPANYTM